MTTSLFRQLTSDMCDLIGRPMTLKRGATEVAFNGVLRGLRPEELVNSADQGTLECVIPAKQMTSIVPKKFDRIAAGGREFTIQFVRECYDGAELSAYKARVLG